MVDADPAARDSISSRLRNSGYRVSSAAAGKAVLDQLTDPSLALIVLDRALTGLDTLRQIRTQHSPALLPVIYLTDHTQKLNEALDAGANDYIARPIDYPVALGRIRAQLDRRAAELAALRAGKQDSPAHAGTSDVLWDWDLAADRVYLSERWNELLGSAGDNVFHSTAQFLDSIHPDDRPRFEQAIAAAGPELQAEFRLHLPGQEEHWVRAHARVERDPAGRPRKLTGSLTDLTTGYARDVATGLPLRQHLLDRLGISLERTRCGETGPFALLLIDLDGQPADDLLTTAAARLEAVSQAPDTCAPGQAALLARLSRERFALLLEGLRTSSDAIRLAERLLREFVVPFSDGRQLTASVGIAPYTPSHRTPGDLLRDADTALDRARGYGPNRWEIFCDDMRVQVVYRLHFENALRRALDEQEFRVAYQPIVQLQDRKIVGLEALLRWPTFGLGTCRLEEVIRVAEETGLIVEIGRWVLKEACLQMRQIHQFFPRAPRLSLHVNVSEKQFSLDDLDQVVSNTLRESGIAPEQLKLEITETALMHQRRDVRETLERLKSRSVRLGIDDFGTGYASLNYLHQFPFDTLKLDRTFIARLGRPGTNPEIARAVIHLAHALRMEVVAEGIEDDHQATLMRDLGCGFGQGYLFAHPMLAHQVLMSVLAKQFS